MEEIIMANDGQQADLGPESRPETPENLKKLIEHCIGLYDLFKDSEYRAGKLTEIKKSREAYEQIEQKSDFPFQNASSLTLPLTTITVDNLEPRFVAALAGKEPYVMLTMQGMEKKDEPTEIVEDFFNKELKNNVKLEHYTMGHVHQLLLEGSVFSMPSYALEEKVVREFVYDQQGNVAMKQVKEPVINPETGQPVMQMDPATGQSMVLMRPVFTGEPMTQDATVVEREGGCIEIVPFKDMYYADDLGTIEEWEAADKIRMVFPTYADLMKKKDDLGYRNIGPWLLQERGGKEITEQERIPTSQIDVNTVITGKETVECVECHITYPIYRDETKEEKEQTDFTEERIIATIALQSQTLIRLVLNRDLLFNNASLIKRSRLFPEPGRSCGTPIYGKLKSVQEGCSDMFNAIIDIAYVTMIPWFFYDQRAGIKGEIGLYPGKGVPVDNVQGVMIPQFRINPSQYLDFVNLYMSMWERVGNLSDWNMGITNQAGGKKTASEVLAVIQEGNIAHNYRANTVREEYILILKTLYDLYYQFMPLQKTFTYQGKPLQIPRRAMKRDFRFVLTGSSETANKLIERKTSEDLMGLFGGDPLINPLKPREEVLKNYGINDIDEWIMPQANQLIQALMTNPEIVQVVGKYLQDKQQIAAVVQGGPKPTRRPEPGPGSIPERAAAAAGGIQ